jgi:hypothetical protein
MLLCLRAWELSSVCQQIPLFFELNIRFEYLINLFWTEVTWKSYSFLVVYICCEPIEGYLGTND